MQQNRSVNSGFTLIELLVVIAIIAILAAILFPVFAKVREKARQTSCLSNEKQLGLGFIQYSEDYDEAYPSGTQTNAGVGWAGQLYAYVKSTQVFTCPDDPTAPTTAPIAFPISYGMNEFAATNSQAAFVSPSRTVMLFEVVGATANISTPWNGATGDSTSPVADGNPQNYFPGNGRFATGVLVVGDPASVSSSTVAFYDQKTGRHTDGSNFEMFDGHAKWLRGAAVSSGGDNQLADGNCNAYYPTVVINGRAASADCSAPGLVATFSVH